MITFFQLEDLLDWCFLVFIFFLFPFLFVDCHVSRRTECSMDSQKKNKEEKTLLLRRQKKIEMSMDGGPGGKI